MFASWHLVANPLNVFKCYKSQRTCYAYNVFDMCIAKFSSEDVRLRIRLDVYVYGCTCKCTSLTEPRCEKIVFFFAYAKTKTQISFVVTAKRISAFVFATRIVQSLYFLNPKFQASSHLLWLYSLVCIGPGRKPRRPIFSQRGTTYWHTLKGNASALNRWCKR